jgi:hypothetical protein
LRIRVTSQRKRGNAIVSIGICVFRDLIYFLFKFNIINILINKLISILVFKNYLYSLFIVYVTYAWEVIVQSDSITKNDHIIMPCQVTLQEVNNVRGIIFGT